MTRPIPPQEDPAEAAPTTTAAPPNTIEVALGDSVYTGVTLKWSHYVHDSTNIIPALSLYIDDDEYGPELLTVATVNLPEVGPDAGCILVKDWSENEGLLDSLVKAGVLQDDGIYVTVNRWGSRARQGRVLPPYSSALEAALALAAAQ